MSSFRLIEKNMELSHIFLAVHNKNENSSPEIISPHLGQQHRGHGRGRVGVGCARCAWHHKYDKRLTYYQGLRVVKERLLVSSNFGDKLSSKTRIKPSS